MPTDHCPERLRIALAHLAQAAEQYLRELCCVYHDANGSPCAPDDQGGYCCDNCPTLAAHQARLASGETP
jgi:hypothetical protein